MSIIYFQKRPFPGIALLLAFSSLYLTACHFSGDSVKGNGHVVTEDRNVPGFEGVRSSGSSDLYVSEGAQSLKIEAEENLLPYIETEVRDGILRIGVRDNTWMRTTKDVKIYISAPTFKVIRSSGSGDIIGQSRISNPDRIEVGVAGSADINLEVDAPELESEIAGSGNVDLKGVTRNLKAKISGSGNIRAGELQTENTEIRIAGSGDATVFASVKLDVRITGSGSVKHKGGAQVNTHVTGSGSVTKLD
ncbi:MAG: DUF2807 domain-containing protein [Candidatus Pseudobacter hemicellulosilyticus]|uniref:DUF2807 domain-containing protein n=1 Tax=Candidatus Pseudobacter hemicellulosilyticus TaxID=3121375 RepID=A0AAJ6BG23_9BACT|nr:MAG: DUF2807 domain-containing protein [Pseudobacter sp.]